MENERPDPDRLLAEVTAREAETRRGRLRIYFGASAGVGKTFAMLAAARALRSEGKDVVAGVVETHGRKETEALLQNLPILPPAEIAYQGRTLREFDLDGALARHPALILVDELAHTNVQGSRHPKRWQDIDELLERRRRRVHDAQRAAPREPERRRRRNHRHQRLGDGARFLFRQGRRGRAGRRLGRRSPRASQGRQGVPARADRARREPTSSARAT